MNTKKSFLDTNKKVLHLIDANNWVNRAYYATPPMNTMDGTGTNAVKAFSNMLYKIIQAVQNPGKPTYMAACFDIRRSEVFRSAVFAEWKKKDPGLVKALFPPSASTQYKGDRNKGKDDRSIEDLIEQVQLSQFLCEIAGIPTFSGKTIGQPVEADDIIGTLSQIPHSVALIYSRDKDFVQLVGKKVRILQQAQSNSDEVHITNKNAFYHMGVRPDQVIEYLMLVGDKVDSIPGVPGCGPGGACNLLLEHDTIKGIQESYAAVEGRYKGVAYAIAGKPVPPKKKGEQPKPTIRPDFKVTKKLATIVLDVPGLPTKIEQLKIKQPDIKKLKKMKQALEFSQLLWV